MAEASALMQAADAMHTRRRRGGKPGEIRMGAGFFRAAMDEAYAAHTRGGTTMTREDWHAKVRADALRGEVYLYGARVVLDERLTGCQPQ